MYDQSVIEDGGWPCITERRHMGRMVDKVLFRSMRAGDEDAVSELVIRTFNEFIAPGYSSEGIKEFLSGTNPEKFLWRVQQGQLILVAIVEDEIVGVIEIRNHDHISLLFVDAEHHRRGIAEGLFQEALKSCQDQAPGLAEVTVNSSPYAVPIYRKLGFQQLQPEQVHKGMRFVPMALGLGELD